MRNVNKGLIHCAYSLEHALLTINKRQPDDVTAILPGEPRVSNIPHRAVSTY